MGRRDAGGGAQLLRLGRAGEPRVSQVRQWVGLRASSIGLRRRKRKQSLEGREAFLVGSALRQAQGHPAQRGMSGGWQSQEPQDAVTNTGPRGALGALEAVELALGEVEQGSGLDERQVVLHPKGAEAGAQVARAEAGAEQKVEGVAVVVGELFGNSLG